MKIDLTPTEEVLMQCLWESGADLTVYEMTERLKYEYGKEYAQNAISTFMKTLLKKGAVSRYKKHHSHQYHSEINMDEYRERQLENFKHQWYQDSAYSMMASLVKTEDISENELQKLKEMLDGYIDKN